MEHVAIPLTDAQRAHMRSRVESGDFGSEGDYLQALIALDREIVEALRAALQEGLDSGVSDRSIEEILADGKRRWIEARSK